MTGLYGIVGGPNTGKTTTIRILKRRGHHVLNETATPIIKEQKKIGGHVVPWENFDAFQRAVFHMQLAREIIARGNIAQGIYDKAVFSDRLYIDTHGYYAERDLVPYEMVEHSLQDPRNRPDAIFLLQQLPPEAYILDGVRWEDDQRAIRLHACLDAAYRRAAEVTGAPLVDVPYIAQATPRKSAVARADFILERIAQGF